MSSVPAPRPSDHDLELSVANMLRIGVTLAAIIVLLGGLLSLRHPFSHIPDYTHFRAPTAPPIDPNESRNIDAPTYRHFPTSISSVLKGVRHGRAPAIIQLGLLLLIATPVARVVLCVIGFARQRDKLYVAISLTVLAILLYSLASGLR